MNHLLSRSGNAVIALPQGFKLNDELAAALEIRIASAYVRTSGWCMLKDYIFQGNAKVYLLCGLDFSLTQPQVLKEWRTLHLAARAQARICSISGFHPKAMIVTRTDGSTFAIVGSGNLSAGGLQKNVELSVYIQDATQVEESLKWFEDLFESDNLTAPVTAIDLDAYELRYLEAAALRRTLPVNQVPVRRKVQFKGSSDKWRSAIAEARQFMHEPNIYASRNNPDWTPAMWKQAADDIKSALDYPQFDLTDERFREFYRIWTLGHLRPINRDKVYVQREKLVAGLRQLIDDSLPIEERVDAVIGKLEPTYIKNFGINAVTKILAAHAPTHWPVYNKAVYHALKDLDVEFLQPKDGKTYKAFADIMHEFISEAGMPDMLHLDCFLCNFRPPRGLELQSK